MACSEYEPLIALYVEGDHVTPEIEDHLRACADCRALAGELRQSQELVRSLREEEIPDAALAAVRSRVLDRVASRRPSWLFALRWWHGIAAAAATAVVAFLMLPGPAVPPPAPPPPPSAAGPRPAVAAPARAARGAAPRKPQEPLLVKMFTDDPDVVIYWLIDQNGDSL